MQRSVFNVTAILLAMTSMVYAYSGGSGTPEDPYQIATAQDLIDLGNRPNDYDKHFILTVDIDLDPNLPGRMVFDRALIAPDIDDIDRQVFQGTPFSGTFNGNSHEISNLCVAGLDSLGFFGALGKNGIVKDLGITNVSIKGDSNGMCRGGLAGICYGGYISRCYATGLVQGGRYYTGGLVGRNYNCLITSCFTDCSISGESDVGGLIGLNEYIVKDCHSSSSVTGTYEVGGLVGYHKYGSIAKSYSNGHVVGNMAMGGFAGSNNGVISACFWDIASSGQVESDGGVGLTTSQMQYQATFDNAGWGFFYPESMDSNDCWFMPEEGYPVLAWQTEHTGLFPITVDVTGLPIEEARSQMVQAGYAVNIASGYHPTHNVGIVIQAIPRYFGMAGEPITLLENRGDYDWQDNSGTGTPESPYQITSLGQFLCLTQQRELYNRYFELRCDIDLVGPHHGFRPRFGDFSGSFNGCGHVIRNFQGWGGLFRYLLKGGRIANLGIENINIEKESSCHSGGIGALVNTNAGRISTCYSTGDMMIGCGGGLAGENYGTIEHCYSTCSISATYAAGGLVGINAASIISCYSSGRIVGEDNTDCGGFIGRNYDGHRDDYHRIVTHCLWDTENSGQTNSAGGIGLTTAELMYPEMLAWNGWADDPNWVLDPGKDYPRLAWEGTPGEEIPQVEVDWLGGQGTDTNPYHIETLEQFNKLSIASGLWDKHFILKGDIDLATTMWSRAPLADFYGSFDGNGYAIHNLSIYEYSILGLIGTLHTGACITNLKVMDANVFGIDDHVGILVGTNRGFISQCKTSGSVKGQEHVGGLVGSNDRGEITLCSSHGVVYGSDHTGGLVGYQENALLSNCYTSAIVSGQYSIGNLIGENGGFLLNSYANGSFTDAPRAGGLIGHQSSIQSSSTMASFWDMETTGLTTSDGGEGKTSAELMALSLFETNGWYIAWEDEAVASHWRLPRQNHPPYLFNESNPDIPSLPAFSGGSGTPDDPYLLSTIQDLQGIGGMPPLLDKHFRLVKDIDLEGTPIPMVGWGGLPFKGSFDGGEYTLANLAITSDRDLVGFFTIIGRGAKITNLSLNNVSVSGRDYVGGLAGLNTGSVTNCTVTGRVSGNDGIGGLIGWNWNDDTVQDVQTNVEVTGNNLFGPLVGLDGNPYSPHGWRGGRSR